MELYVIRRLTAMEIPQANATGGFVCFFTITIRLFVIATRDGRGARPARATHSRPVC